MKNIDSEKSNSLVNEQQVSPFLADILSTRDIDIFNQDELESPFALADMQKAVDRIEFAVENEEKIAIYGDYDCDGITSTVILYTYLTSIGADVRYYIPNRIDDGYGINLPSVEEFKQHGVKLIITVDTGISAISEANYIKDQGIDLIITDHHQVSKELPHAVAVINPHRPDCNSKFKDLAGVGVAFKLITALEGGDYQTTLDFFSDIATIGTIADIVPLVGDNRTIINHGLKMLSVSENLGINALMEIASLNSKEITSSQVAFGLVPRLNASGRLDDAKISVDLLLSDDEDEATELALMLDKLNSNRKDLEAKILEQIEEELTLSPQKLANRVLVFWGEDFTAGVQGIVCSRLVERFSKPVVILSISDGEATGSARSLGEFSIFEAFTDCRDLLTHFGGHKLAGGLSLPIDKLEEFELRINQYAKTHFDNMPNFEITYDRELNADEITVSNALEIQGLSPFGHANQMPLFLMKKAKILEIFSLCDDKHVRLKVEFQGTTFFVLNFSVSSIKFPYSVGDIVDIIALLEPNTYKGNVSTSLKLKDIRKSDFSQEKFFSAKSVYEKFVLGEDIDKRLIERIIPTRDEIAQVYTKLRQIKGYNSDIDYLYEHFDSKNFNYCKLRLILDILREMKTITQNPALGKIRIEPNPEKTTIESSHTYIKLGGML